MSSEVRSRRLQAVPDPPAAAVTDVAHTSVVQFSDAVRRVVGVARRGRLSAPVFRSPPRLVGVDRSIRRRANGTVVVAVRRLGRPLAAVQADIIEGVVAANALDGSRADRFRHAAWQQLVVTSVGPPANPQADPPAPRRVA